MLVLENRFDEEMNALLGQDTKKVELLNSYLDDMNVIRAWFRKRVENLYELERIWRLFSLGLLVDYFSMKYRY